MKLLLALAIIAAWYAVVWLLTKAPAPAHSYMLGTGRYAPAIGGVPVQAERPAPAGREGAVLVTWAGTSDPVSDGLSCWLCGGSETREVSPGRMACLTCGGL